ncbi:serine hydrolase domain-containing protein [Colwellia psychrerythraea]|uniref:Beta-lactamase n=1 Tax=Colwellia psychrerythraea TaxID=28229 RepID=A0A099KBX3_COLPS|nr:serine hydrolase domain-containing protein [Colwellia psychrerythraea]KGJ88204.1 beta-lactamase [Colwellia psychrerythraea]
MAIPKKLKSLLFSSIILSLAACGGGDKNETKVPDPIITVEPPAFNYQAAIDGALSDTIPGVILLVEKPGFKFLGSAGLADIETQTPMQTYHVMLNGSAGKKLTALLTVMLAEEGLLSLDDPLDNWLSEEILAQIDNSEQMTIRQLLNHTSGIYNYTDGTNHDNFYEAVFVSNKEQLKTDSYALDFGLNRAAYSLPGEEYHYSNTAYLLVGLILDEVLGEHHSSAMRNRILNPFGMNSSFYNGVEKSLGEIISGYAITNEYGVINTKPYYENIGLADAPLSSNVEDLALLLKFIVDQDGHVSEYVQEQLFGESHLVDTGESILGAIDQNASYGLGLFKEVINNKVVYHHNGIELGYSTTNIYINDSQTSITAFFNCGESEQCRLETKLFTQAILLNEL